MHHWLFGSEPVLCLDLESGPNAVNALGFLGAALLIRSCCIKLGASVDSRDYLLSTDGDMMDGGQDGYRVT